MHKRVPILQQLSASNKKSVLKFAATLLQLLFLVSNLWSPVSAQSFEPADNSPIYRPTGLDDPRLAKDPSYVPGTSSYSKDLLNRYSHELYRYARKLYEQEKYKEALPLILLAMENRKDGSITFDQPDKIYINICLGIANQESGASAEKYYGMALAACDKHIKKGNLTDNYCLLKTKALMGLGRRDEAILACQEAYNFAFAWHDKTVEPSACLKQLTGLSHPSAEFNNRNHSKIQKDILTLAERKIAPTQQEIENIFGTSFDAGLASYCEKNIIGGAGIYENVRLRLASKAKENTTLIFMIKKESAGVTEEMVRQWFANLIPIVNDSGGTRSLVFKQPASDTTICFSSLDPKLAYQLSFDWHQASEIAQMPESPEQNHTIIQESFADLLAKGDYKAAFRSIETEIVMHAPLGGYPSKDVRDGIRAKLVKLYEVQKKPEIVSYLKVASFQELVMMMNWIHCENRSDFYTIKEYLAEKYTIGGELDKDFKGTLLVCGFQGNRIALITEKTEAAKVFLDSLHVKLPLKKFAVKTFHCSSSTGPLLDEIAEQQYNLEQKRDNKSQGVRSN